MSASLCTSSLKRARKAGEEDRDVAEEEEEEEEDILALAPGRTLRRSRPCATLAPRANPGTLTMDELPL